MPWPPTATCSSAARTGTSGWSISWPRNSFASTRSTLAKTRTPPAACGANAKTPSAPSRSAARRRSAATSKERRCGWKSPARSSRRSRRILLDRTRFTTQADACRPPDCTWEEIDRVLAGRRLDPHADGASDAQRAFRQGAGRLGLGRRGGGPRRRAARRHPARPHARQSLPFKIKNVNSHSLGVVATDPKTGRSAQRDPHSAQHAAAGHRQADFQDPKDQPAVDSGADRRRGKRLARGLLAARQSAWSATCRRICRPTRRSR